MRALAIDSAEDEDSYLPSNKVTEVSEGQLLYYYMKPIQYSIYIDHI